jgi:hypothetical protein
MRPLLGPLNALRGDCLACYMTEKVPPKKKKECESPKQPITYLTAACQRTRRAVKSFSSTERGHLQRKQLS